MLEIPELYFKNDIEFKDWLHNNHYLDTGIHLIFYSVAHENESMRWEEAVQVALCYGWIDSTVKSLGDGKRRQYFCKRKPKSVWSRVNKDYIKELKATNKMHAAGLAAIKIAKQNGSCKSYLYWLNQAKRQETRTKRVKEIIHHSAENIKYRDGGGWQSAKK